MKLSLLIIVCALFLNIEVRCEKKPNVIFIVIDDMNDWISLLNSDSPIKTPNLERLAGKGMLFTNAYCPSPACNPSRVSVLTGLRPSSSGVYGNNSDWRKALPKRKTIFQKFMDHGYKVKGAGKIFHHKLNGAFHDQDSFDEFQHMSKQDHPKQKLNNAPEYGSIRTDWGRFPNNEKDSIDYKTIDYCVEVIKENKSNNKKPLFLACGIYRPHSPFYAPQKFHEMVGNVELPIRKKNDLDDLPFGARNLMKSTRWFWNGMDKLDSKIPGSYQSFINSYAACCVFADQQVGRLLDAVEENLPTNETIIILWSDHGFHLGEKNHIEKFMLWEKTTHVPFVFVAPGITKPGSKCSVPIDLTVLYPTILDVCSIEADEPCDNVSIKKLLKGEANNWNRPAIMTYLKGNHAVRNNRWRYIRYSDGSEELYDHHEDKNEWNNVADVSKNAKIIKSMSQWLPAKEKEQISNLRR